MILVTVGMQLPFDRLLRSMESLAPTLGEEVVAQTGRSAVPCSFVTSFDFLSPEHMRSLAAQARVIVSHAGIGSVLMAQKATKPLILFPRDSSRGEHRSDHQFATCRELAKLPGIYIAWNETELSSLLRDTTLCPATATHESARLQQLVSALRMYLESCGAMT